ncbi:MAG TPA: PAS domain S-box protein [Thioalkalivibrio sp.]|nr:PAS domain S-box protein [Thioalkalivibrio sp.]
MTTIRREADLRELVEMLPEAVFETDAEGGLTFANQRAFELFGYTPEDFRDGINVLQTIAPEEREQAHASIQAVLEGRKGGRSEWTGLRKDGSTFPMAVYPRPIIDHGRPIGLRGILVDISEQKELEAQLLHSQKMEAMGRLAGGIAHDFNNMLTAIQGNAQLLHTELAEHPQWLELVDDILTAARRSAELTRHLLAFSRRQVLRPRLVNVNDVIVGLEPMLRRIIPESIIIEPDLAPDVQQIHADPVQIQQVVINLAVNARDAMPDGGLLTLATANCILDGTVEAAGDSVRPGAYVMLAVSDTGIGMDEETQARVFEPFHAIGRVSGETGLGLSAAYGIVRQTEGTIRVVSAPGAGTTFQVFLPATPAEVDVMDGEYAEAPEGGSETLLVVEDEEVVRSLIVELLERFGYTVLQAETAPKALELCAGHDGRIDLLITDVVMPGMDGVELAEAVAAVRPDTEVLYVSGYSDRSLAFRGRAEADVRYLQKPFDVQEFIALIREILDAPR